MKLKKNPEKDMIESYDRMEKSESMERKSKLMKM